MPRVIRDKYFGRSDLSHKKKYELRHKDRIKELSRQDFKRLKADLQKYLYKSAKARASRSGIEFSIIKEDIVVPEVCPILLIPLFSTVGGKASSNSPSLDRVDSNKGYTKDNIRVISHRSNSNKGNMTIEEVARMLDYMRGNI